MLVYSAQRESFDVIVREKEGMAECTPSSP